MVLHNLVPIVEWFAGPATGDQSTTTTVALYSMVSAIGVAFIGILGQLIASRFGRRNEGTNSNLNPNSPAALRRVSKEHEAWERWLLLNDLDPRKIKTGYEPIDEVRR